MGTLTIRLTATDKAGKTASDIFVLTVENVNDAPVAMDDRVSTSESTQFSLAASRGVLSNDTDPDSGDTRVVSAVNGMASSIGRAITLSGGGQVTIRQNGAVVFDPNGAYTGLNAGQSVVEQVRYTIVDSKGATSTASLFITIEGRNNGPVLQPDKIVTVDQDSGAIGLSITRPVDAEGDPLTITISALPNTGSVATAEGVKRFGRLAPDRRPARQPDLHATGRLQRRCRHPDLQRVRWRRHPGRTGGDGFRHVGPAPRRGGAGRRQERGQQRRHRPDVPHRPDR